MIQFIYGRAGSGKSSLLHAKIIDSLKHNGRCLLIVPEQQALAAEESLTDAALQAGAATINLEVVSFTRLSNRVFREYGGLSYHYVDRGARALIMWHVLYRLTPVLSVYRGIRLNDRGALRMMLDTVDECKRYGVTPAALSRASEELERTEDVPSMRLGAKLADLSLIYAAYEEMLHTDYDDPTDDIGRMADLLDEHNFFGPYHVYIDSFSGFTPGEYRVLEHIFSCAQSVTVTLPCLPGDEESAFRSIRKTDRLLRRTAARSGIDIAPDILLRENHRTVHKDLRLLEQYLWDFTHTGAVCEEIPSHLHLIAADDIYAEAEEAARDIRRRLYNDPALRYRDFLVVVRDTSRYRGVVDAVFEKYHIPYFLSARSDLASHPLIRLISSALAAIAGHFRRDDVILYAKSGLAGISAVECDLLESYAAVWNIEGSRWTAEEDWHMNPDGYREEITERGEFILQTVNEARRKLIPPLLSLSDSLHEGETVRTAAGALYDFLTCLGIPERLQREGSDEDCMVWNEIMRSLDRLADIAPEARINADIFAQLLTVMFEEADTGRIPTAMDEVTIGSAFGLRAKAVKAVYLLGVNDGIFPADTAEDNVLSDTERLTLETMGIELAPSCDDRACDELYYFYRSAAAASEEVVVIFSTADLNGKALKPSLAVTRMQTLFPRLPMIRTADLPPEESVWDREAAFELTASLTGTPVGESLKRLYRENPADGYAQRLEAQSIPVSQPENRLSSAGAARLYPGNLYLTQSRLDRYASCGFSYHCQYILHLEDKRPALFGSADIGTLVHRILERAVAEITRTDGFDNPPDDAAIDHMLDGLLADYADAVVMPNGSRTGRLKKLFVRLKRTCHLLVSNLINEFRESRFIPAFFELPITMGDPDAVTPLSIPLEDGSEAFIYGKIDRVDTFKKGKDVFFRVIDYKTGHQDFSLERVQEGFHLQMLLYLFAIWQNASETFRQRAGCEKDGSLLPAGVLYFSARTPDLLLPGPQSDADTIQMANETLIRRGVLLDDTDILEAMEPDLRGHFLPLSKKNDGVLKTIPGAPLQTLEQLGDLMERVKDVVRHIGSEIKQGKADAIPHRNGGHSPCEYCSFKALCRVSSLHGMTGSASSENPESTEIPEKAGDRNE